MFCTAVRFCREGEAQLVRVCAVCRREAAAIRAQAQVLLPSHR